MISLIVAHDLGYVIGKDNKMPWHYPEDLQYFKKTTLHKDVLVGRNTYESILSYLKKPLPNRVMHVLTSKKSVAFDTNVYHNIGDVLKAFANKDEELFVAGGAQIYEAFMPYADRLYITLINKRHVGDSFFPTYNLDDFNLLEESKSGDLTFMVLERKA